MNSRDAKWNSETNSGTYSDKIHHGEVRMNNPITNPKSEQAMSKQLTPLQMLREQIRDGREFQTYTREEIGQMINALYPVEQKLLSDAFDAGANYQYGEDFGRIPNPQPNKKTFISQFNQGNDV